MSQVFFSLGNVLIMPFWLSMMVLPRHGMTRRLLQVPWICAVLACLYGVLVVPNLPQLLPLLINPQLDSIRALLSSPLGASAAWLHFLCFDLFVGRWLWSDALSRPTPMWLLRICLCLTLLLGPLGLLVYGAATRLRWRQLSASPLINQAAWMTTLVAVSLLGLALDPRLVTSAPVWLKPLKFALSVMIYNLTLEALLRRVDSSWVGPLSRLTATCFGLELLIIYGQAARGTTSHFNQDTPLDAVLFALMGLGILVLWMAAMVTMVLLWRSPDRQVRAPLGWAMLVAVVGMGVGWPMSAWGAHTVGAADGGPGLPLLGWSTQAGDLRVPHFFGIHALQLVPLLWLALRRWRPGLAWTAGPGYLGVVLLLTLQALRCRPLLSWDGPLLAWLGIWWLLLSLAGLRRR